MTTGTSFETDIVTSLFPRVAAITIVFCVGMIFFRDHLGVAAGSKMWDRAAFAASVIGAMLLSLRFVWRSVSAPSRLAVVVVSSGFVWGIARVEHHANAALFWEGFGTSVAVLSVPVALLIVPVSVWVRQSRMLSRALAIPACVLAVLDLTSLFRNLSDFPNTANNMFVLNEVLAPSAGRVPGATFIPQYTILFGWIFAPFRHLASAYTLANSATIVISMLGIAAVVLGVILARHSLPKRSLWLAVALTVPITTVTALHSGIQSSIGAYLQDLPIRMFPAMLFSLFAVRYLVAQMDGAPRKWVLVTLSAFVGLMAWNSQDFGLATAVAFGIVLQIATRPFRKRVTLLWISGLAFGLILYPLWTIIIGHPIKLNYMALTARSFASGFGSSLMQIPGPALLVLPLILGSLSVGVCLLWKDSECVAARPKHQQYAVATLAFVGAWSTIALPYYVNRSYASGQLQLFLLPAGVCCCSLLSLCQPAMRPGDTRDGSRFRDYLKSRAVWLLPVTLPIAVGFGAIVQSPSPSVTLDTLTHPPASIGFLETVPIRPVLLALTYVRKHGGGSVGYFGSNANYLNLLTGVQPRILYDDPSDLGLSEAAHEVGCEFVRRHPTEWMVIGEPVVPRPNAFVLSYVGHRICNDYLPWNVPGEPPNTVFKLHEP